MGGQNSREFDAMFFDSFHNLLPITLNVNNNINANSEQFHVTQNIKLVMLLFF